MIEALEVDILRAVLFESLADNVTVARSSLAEIVSILFFRHVAVLKHFAINEERIVRHGESDAFHCLAACGDIPEIVDFHAGFRIDGIGMNADVLGSVITETAYAEAEQVIDKLHVIFLEVGVFGVYVGKSAGLSIHSAQTLFS